MSNLNSTAVEKNYKALIIIVSVLIPLTVTILFSVKLKDFGVDVKPLSFLPPIYATINGITAVLLLIAVKAIKNGNRIVHKNVMKMAIFCSILFLGMYVAYHMTADSVRFGDVDHDGILNLTETAAVGSLRYMYFFILTTHILLSIVIIPMVLVTYVRALSHRFDKHKKLARITFPLWLYVAVTGVVVYLMISPYYVK